MELLILGSWPVLTFFWLCATFPVLMVFLMGGFCVITAVAMFAGDVTNPHAGARRGLVFCVVVVLLTVGFMTYALHALPPSSHY
jgi:hypothetical protein